MKIHDKDVYKVEACPETFDNILKLKHKIQLIAGLWQNDMEVTGQDLLYVKKQITEINTELLAYYSKRVCNLGENLNPCKHEHVDYWEDFDPHKGYKKIRYCTECQEEL
jgi:hypothetical protein